ncbi:MAG TPA: GNAT family N-acetyltransferase [Nitrospirota bacterium]|nr:GNAT family N-acetyltransferase [Nitrospirota bacterium]
MFVEVSTEYQIEIVESLAREIWTEHYIPIIGREQVDYMLATFQSRRAIGEQIRTGIAYFLIKEDDAHIGYMAVQPKGRELFLSKIYVKSSRRGLGYGRKAVQYAEKVARDLGLDKIVLTVNKNNVNSIKAYEKIGFTNAGPVVQDIGSGFVMDDYKMEKKLS